MTRIVRYYVKPDGQFYGGWEGDPDIYEDPYPEMGYVQVPHAAPSVQWHWNFEKRGVLSTRTGDLGASKNGRSLGIFVKSWSIRVARLDDILQMRQGAFFKNKAVIMHEGIVAALAAEWRSAGVEEGDTLLVHSSLSRTLRKVVKMGGGADPSIVVRSFLHALGSEGTLIAPLFNFEFTQGVPFDIRESKSAMGSFTEAVRKWPGAVRTGHPIYSFAALGKNANQFMGVENFSGYGADSPFAIIHKLGGKIGIIDLPDQHSMTIYHYVEEANSAPYRYHKTFTGDYTEADGSTSKKTFGLFVRDIEKGVLTKVDPMGEILWEKGLYSGFRPGAGCGLRVIKAAPMFVEVSRVISAGSAKGILYDVQ